MNKKNVFINVLIASCILFYISCGRSTGNRTGIDTSADTVFYFSGMFMYFADAPVLRDCATGFTLSVAMERDYLRAEREYNSLEPYQGEYIYVEFMGNVSESILENGEGLPYTVKIDSLIEFDRDKNCDFENLIAGVYETDMNKMRSNLRLTGNYEFIHTVFDTGNESKADIYTGRWGRISDKELVLVYEMLDGAEHAAKQHLTFDRVNDVLLGIEEGSTVVFKKVYL